jgi:hypothetical protein
MAYFTLSINAVANPVGEHRKHHDRKHGKNAYYGQTKNKQ